MDEPGALVGQGRPGERYRFGEIEVDAGAHTLSRAGAVVQVEPKAFAVLLVLLRHAGALVPRDDLLDAVWGHRHVTPGVLTRAIAQLRAAMGDDAQQPRYIQTQHALGYRFIATLEGDTGSAGAPMAHGAAPAATGALGMPVDALYSHEAEAARPPVPEVASAGSESHRSWSLIVPGDTGRAAADSGLHVRAGAAERRALSWRWGVVAAVVAAVGLALWFWLAGPGTRPTAPSEPSIAVLPFTSLGQDVDDRYFAEGLASELHDALAGVPGLKVAAHLAPSSGGRAERDPATLGRRLGVATVLDATVRREGQRVRINARLTDSQSGYTLWAESYEREASGVFDVQSEIAEKVVDSLMGVLPANQSQLARRLKPTLSAAAYDAYLKGVQQLLVPRSEQALGRAVAFFNQALKEDAGFARAQAGICRAEIRRFEAARDAAAFTRARTACERAARMDPKLLDVSLAMGDLDRTRGEYPRAIEHYTRALNDVALRPEAYVGLAATHAALGNNPLALDYYERAHQLRPGDATIHAELGYHHYLNGNLDKAIASYRIATTLQPDAAKLWNSLGGLYYVAGRRREAANAFTRSLALEPTPGALSNYASLRFEDGAYAEAASLYRRAAQLDPDDYRLWGNIGDALSADPETAAQARSPYARAASMAEAYIKLKGDDAMGPAHLAWYRANLGRAGEVRGLLARADALGTETAEVEYFAAQALARIGDRDGARERVRRALEAGVPLQRIRTSPLLRGMEAEGASRPASPGSSAPPSKA
ncbi:tetratricopeptide repeat protein [Lysobacter olei]